MKELREKIEFICEDLRRILTFNHINNGLWDIIENNESLQKDNLFYWWLGSIYYDAIAIGIRKFTDEDKRSISLINLLKDIKNKSINNVILKKDIENEIALLNEETKNIKTIVNKRIAHRGRERIENIPNYQEIQDCLSYLQDIVVKYFQILYGAGYHIDFSDDWKKIFRHAWIE